MRIRGTLGHAQVGIEIADKRLWTVAIEHTVHIGRLTDTCLAGVPVTKELDTLYIRETPRGLGDTHTLDTCGRLTERVGALLIRDAGAVHVEVHDVLLTATCHTALPIGTCLVCRTLRRGRGAVTCHALRACTTIVVRLTPLREQGATAPPEQ